MQPRPDPTPTLVASVPALVPPVAEGWGGRLMQGSVGLPLEVPAGADPVSHEGNALALADGVSLTGTIVGDVGPDASLNIDVVPGVGGVEPLHNFVGIGRGGPFELRAPPKLGAVRLLAMVEVDGGVRAYGSSDVFLLGETPVDGLRIELQQGAPAHWATGQ